MATIIALCLCASECMPRQALADAVPWQAEDGFGKANRFRRSRKIVSRSHGSSEEARGAVDQAHEVRKHPADAGAGCGRVPGGGRVVIFFQENVPPAMSPNLNAGRTERSSVLGSVSDIARLVHPVFIRATNYIAYWVDTVARRVRTGSARHDSDPRVKSASLWIRATRHAWCGATSTSRRRREATLTSGRSFRRSSALGSVRQIHQKGHRDSSLMPKFQAFSAPK